MERTQVSREGKQGKELWKPGYHQAFRSATSAERLAQPEVLKRGVEIILTPDSSLGRVGKRKQAERKEGVAEIA